MNGRRDKKRKKTEQQQQQQSNQKREREKPCMEEKPNSRPHFFLWSDTCLFNYNLVNFLSLSALSSSSVAAFKATKTHSRRIHLCILHAR